MSRVLRLGTPLACLLACTAPETATPPEQPAPPQRIVSLAPGLTSMLFQLGAGDRVIGVTRFCDDPPEAAPRARIGGFADPNLEAILALRPDLVIGPASPAHAPILDRLSASGIRVLTVDQPDLASIWRSARRLGAALGVEPRADALIADADRIIEEIRRRSSNRPRPVVLFVFGRNPLVVAGPGAFADELLTLAGGRNAVAGARVPWPKLTFEDVLRAAPEIILDASMDAGDAPDPSFWRAFEATPAVAAGRVIRVTEPGLLQPGPRVVEGLAWLAANLHP